jgi:ATP phosphoribosyltransferase regulatory subunit
MDGTIEKRLVGIFEDAGYPRAHAALLHPADVFIDLSGEDIRRRLYLTQDVDGRELCLRPEFTIPLCRDAVARRSPAAAMSYFGPVFRHRAGEPGEFLQAGVESLGRSDRAAADAEAVVLAVAAAQSLGLRRPAVRLGDVGLLDSMLSALDAPMSYRRRLKRRLAAGREPFPASPPAAAAAGVDGYAGVLAALEGQGPAAARAFVSDMLGMTGVAVSGGRSIDEIAERFLAKARAGDGALPAERQRVLAAFLGLAGDPDTVADGLRRLAADAGLELNQALDAYESRTGFLAAGGIDVQAVRAETRFVRNLDYYTGMTFEITDPALAGGKPLVGGGRYDSLLAKLGAAQDVAAVGFSVWVERFGAAGGAA